MCIRDRLEDQFYSKFPNASFSPYDVYTIYKDNKGSIWFGTANFGVCRFDGKNLAWIDEEELTAMDDGPAPGIRSIIEDKDGNFWFSNILYQYRVSPNNSTIPKKELIDYQKLKGVGPVKTQNGVEFTFFMSAINDKHGNLWMATYDTGVWKYDGENLRHYPIKTGDTSVTLFSIYKDRQDVLWLGTHNFGVFKFNGEVFEKFNSK